MRQRYIQTLRNILHKGLLYKGKHNIFTKEQKNTGIYRTTILRSTITKDIFFKFIQIPPPLKVPLEFIMEF